MWPMPRGSLPALASWQSRVVLPLPYPPPAKMISGLPVGFEELDPTIRVSRACKSDLFKFSQEGRRLSKIAWFNSSTKCSECVSKSANSLFFVGNKMGSSSNSVSGREIRVKSLFSHHSNQ